VSQFRSTRRQRAWWLDRVRRDRRVPPHRSARCKNARSGAGPKIWRGEVRRGRAGQAFEFGEPRVLDGATARSLAAGRHGPRRVGQIVKTKPPRGSCLRILDQSLEPSEPAPQATGCLSSQVRSPGFLKGGLDNPALTEDVRRFPTLSRRLVRWSIFGEIASEKCGRPV
jgi:hypothetical protein